MNYHIFGNNISIFELDKSDLRTLDYVLGLFDYFVDLRINNPQKISYKDYRDIINLLQSSNISSKTSYKINYQDFSKELNCEKLANYATEDITNAINFSKLSNKWQNYLKEAAINTGTCSLPVAACLG